MATFRMRVFRYTGGGSDKVWAICRDGQRVLVFYGKFQQQTLSGGPIKPKDSNLSTEVSRRIQEQLNQGYTELGEYDVADKKILWNQTASTSSSAGKPATMLAYAEFEPHQVAAMKEVLERGFTVRELSDRLEIDLPNGTTLSWNTQRSPSTMTAKIEHGAFGCLAVLAAAEVIKTVMYDQDDKMRTASWLREEPEHFADIPDLRELAVELRLMAPPVKVKSGAARPALW